MPATISVDFYRSEIVDNLQSYDLRIEVTSATDMPEDIFLFQRRVPAYNGSPDDVFIGLADPVDLEEVPVDAPDMAAEVPYMRKSEVTLRFGSMQELEETEELINKDLNNLVKALRAAENLALNWSKTYVGD